MPSDEDDDGGDNSGEGENDKNDEPDGADDDGLLDGGGLVIVVDSLDDFDDADGRKIGNVVANMADGARHDKFVVLFDIFGVGQDAATTEIIGGGDSKTSHFVGVAFVGDGGTKCDGAGESEGRDGIVLDADLVDDLAVNVGVDNAGDLVDTLNIDAFLIGGFGIGGDDNGGVLAADGGILGDVDGEFEIPGRIGRYGAGRLFDGNPLRDGGMFGFFG